MLVFCLIRKRITGIFLENSQTFSKGREEIRCSRCGSTWFPVRWNKQSQFLTHSKKIKMATKHDLKLEGVYTALVTPFTVSSFPVKIIVWLAKFPLDFLPS